MKPTRYHLELAVGMIVYAALLFLSNAVDGAWHPVGAARIALALVPMVGALVVLVVVMRGIARLDEFQRRTQFEALAFGFAGTALVTFGWGFAETAGAPRLSAFSVWPLMASLWIAGLIVARMRYR